MASDWSEWKSNDDSDKQVINIRVSKFIHIDLRVDLRATQIPSVFLHREPGGRHRDTWRSQRRRGCRWCRSRWRRCQLCGCSHSWPLREKNLHLINFISCFLLQLQFSLNFFGWNLFKPHPGFRCCKQVSPVKCSWSSQEGTWESSDLLKTWL